MGRRRIEHQAIDEIECKWCSRCRRWLPLTGFSKDASTWDDLFRRCKECDAAYYAEHKEEIAARQAAHYAAHKEEKAAYYAAYYAEHKEEIAARQAAYYAAYYAAHKEEKAARNAAYYAEHKEEITARQGAYRAEHKEEAASYAATWYVENRDEVCERQRQYRQTPEGKAVSHNSSAKRRGIQGELTGEESAILLGQTHCAYCGAPIYLNVNMHLDHIIAATYQDDTDEPLNEAWNVVYCCDECNNGVGGKFDKLPSDWMPDIYTKLRELQATDGEAYSLLDVDKIERVEQEIKSGGKDQKGECN